MSFAQRAAAHRITSLSILAAVIITGVLSGPSLARPPIRQAFFNVYPSAAGSRLDSVPSHATHCGVCHYDFSGGGTRNPYGIAVGNAIPNYATFELAIGSLRPGDQDADGFTTDTEVLGGTQYTNTPTFPGLTPGNVGQATNVTLSDIQNYLVPAAGGDTTPPSVTVIAPNGGETLTANVPTIIRWSATDASGVAGVSLYLSLDGGATYTTVAKGLSNTGSHTWFPANRPSVQALIRVEAVDNAFNTGGDISNAYFSIISPPGGRVPTTLRDFDMPGSQPFEAGVLNPPAACAVCHGNYDPAVEPYFNWEGSMMAQASRDPFFEAAMTVANQDAPDSGDLCLRCHLPRGWLQGRSVPTDGSQMLPEDRMGVSCDLCHRLVDPILAPENPAEDAGILASLSSPPTHFGNGMMVIDPTGARRGPFVNAASGHPVLVSPFHREAAMCGTCHDVSNPAFEKDALGNYLPNAFNSPATDFSPHKMGPVERTYSEWFHSAYNTPSGVYAPQFGGNKAYVATCQDCHMRDVTGQGCNMSPPTRTDLPLHDMTGGNTWLPGLLPTMFPGEVSSAAMQAGILRARYMLQNAADMQVVQQGASLKVRVTNNTGHKLPTGYPEGRRVWLNVRLYDVNMNLLSESAAYDPLTGILGHDPQAKIYEIEPVTSGIPGLPDGSLFHFVLNNAVHKDNRIPPRGFDNATYASFGGSPVGHTYANGQYWDDTLYTIPPGTAKAVVTLYYQSASKEFVEFLRDENTTNTKGQELFDLWNLNGKCPPEVMATATVTVVCPSMGDYDGDCDVDGQDLTRFEQCASGPAVNYAEGCGNRDLDGDSDVDQGDFGVFQGLLTGSPGCRGNLDCDDGLFCNGTETCVAGQCQAGTPPDCSGLSSQCQVGVCNESSDSCMASPAADGTTCSNGDSCAGDTCQAGVCVPANCGQPFTVLVNGVLDNRTGKDYYPGGPNGAVPMNDLRTLAEEQQVAIPGNNVTSWWQARFEDLASGTLSDVQALVQVRKEDGLTGTLAVEVYAGGSLQLKHTVPTASITGSNTAIPATQVTIPLPTLTGADISVLNSLTIRMYVEGGNNKKVYWSYAQVTGVR